MHVPFELRTTPSGAEVFLAPGPVDLPDPGAASIASLVRAGYERLGTSPIQTRLTIPGEVRVAEKRTGSGELIYQTRGHPIPKRGLRYLLVRMEGWDPVMKPIDLPVFEPVEIELHPVAHGVSEAASGGEAEVDPAAEGRTRVRFESVPEGAEITVDDRFVGCTPAEIDLGPGRYRIALSLPGYESYTKELTVLGTGQTRVLARLEQR